MKNLWQRFNFFSWGLISATLVLQPTQAQAQYIQRSFINPSFESPVFGTSGQQCYVQVNESLIPGWNTTHTPVTGTGSCSGFIQTTSKLIEIWTSGFSGFNTATTPTSAGNQFAELNAEQNSELYQNICLIKDETITFSLLHRGRSSQTVADVANFLIGLNTDPAATIFGTFSTTNDGTVTAQPVAQNGATIPTVSNNNAGNGWVKYSGSVVYNGASGNQPVGFAAVSTGGGDNTFGNFLDEVQFAGKAVVEFTSSSGGGAETETNPTTNPPKLRIVGLVPTGGISVPISVSGTAILGTEFTTTSGTSTFNINIPAGNYDGSDATSVFTIPFTVINNNIPQGVRNIVFTIEPSSSFFTSSTTNCGATATSVFEYIIYDDDFLSGKVWNDLDNSANNTFSNINTGSETGTNTGGLLNAILVDSSNNVLKTTPVAADGTYTFIDVPLNQSNVKIILSTTAGTVGNTAPTASLPATWVNTSPLITATFNTGTNVSSRDFGIKQQSNPNVLLVKRITAINGGTTTFGGDSLVGYIDAPTNAYDDNNITIPSQPTPTDPPKDTDKWPPLNSFILGGINGGNVKPGDEMEYTIYFLSTGDATAPKVLICDRIPDNVSFIPTAFNSFATKNSAGLPSADRGIIWQYNGSTQSLTNTKDGDVAQYFPAGVEPSTVYNDPNNPSKKVVDCGGANTNGAIVVNLGDLPNATGSGTPVSSYGFIRFQGWVK